MSTFSRYCYLWRIDPASDRKGYTRCFMPLSNEYVQQLELGKVGEQWGNHTPSEKLQMVLFKQFHSPELHEVMRSHAGLCLRCYVSEPILNACRKIHHLFGEDQSFTYRDLLPFVLNDDGNALMVLEPDGKAYLVVDSAGTLQATTYKCFSMQILRTFKPDAKSSMSLDNWVYLQTKQNPEVKNFLAEFGFKQLSDWALLNRTRPKQLEQLAERDRHLVEVFHSVYRRDRHQQHQGLNRCLDPTPIQLQEMQTYLKVRDLSLQPQDLMAELRRVALQLRQFDIWSHREPLELDDPETGDRSIRADLPLCDANELDLEQQEQQELLAFFYEQLQNALVDSIQQELNDRIASLRKSKGYASLADRLIPGLDLYYRQGIALKEIADLLKMSGWAQARRVLNPGALISSIRTLTIRQVLTQMLSKAAEKGLTQLPPEPNYLEKLAQEIEALVDAEVFQEAFEEIKAGKNRQMKSVYAQQLCHYLAACNKFT